MAKRKDDSYAKMRAKGLVAVSAYIDQDLYAKLKKSWHKSELNSMAEFILVAIREKIESLKA